MFRDRADLAGRYLPLSKLALCSFPSTLFSGKINSSQDFYCLPNVSIVATLSGVYFFSEGPLFPPELGDHFHLIKAIERKVAKDMANMALINPFFSSARITSSVLVVGWLEGFQFPAESCENRELIRNPVF